MNTQSNAMSESHAESQTAVHRVIPASQHFYWSLRRELWEYRSIYIAPLAVAAVTLFAFLIASIGRAMSTSDLAQRRAVLGEPYTFASLVIMGTTFIVALFYCLDTLHSERRDRSILFWKSLPLSDFTAVLSKAIIPILMLPLLTFAVIIVTQFIMLLLSSAVLLASGLNATALWKESWSFSASVALLYHLVAVHGLWYAPIYGWLLLVSAWARRAVLLWALLPPIVIGVVEKIAFNTAHFANLIGYRMNGGVAGGDFMADTASMDPLMHLAPGKFLATPGLWLGFTFTAICLFAAIRLRRYRDPI
jgi:ABC-2 type transport system permease protein